MDQRRLKDVAAISDPIERIRAVGQLMAESQAAITELSSIRRHAVAEARDGGMTLADIGAALGRSPGRISQYTRQGEPAKEPAAPERRAPRVLVQRAIPTDPKVRGSKSLFLEEAERQGVKGTREMLFIGPEQVNDHVASCLRIEPGTEALARRKMFRVDGVPVRIATSYFRADLFADTRIAEGEFVLPSLQAALESLGYRFGHAEETLRVREATRFEAETMELDPGEWVAEVLRASYSTEDTPVHVLETICSAKRHVFLINQVAEVDEF